MVPDETKVNEDVVNNMETSQKGKSNKRNGKGKHYLPIVRDHLLKCKNWKEIDSQEEYTLPGFKGVPEVLYCDDWKNLPLASENDVFILRDCQLSLGSTHKTTHELNIDGKLTKVSVRRGQCEGVKTCAAKECSSSYIVSRSQKVNRCPRHARQKVALKESGPCPVNVVHIAPVDSNDRRRWIMSLSLAPGGSGHNHGTPSPHSIPTMVKEDIRSAVLADPSRTASDLQKGKLTKLSHVFFIY